MQTYEKTNTVNKQSIIVILMFCTSLFAASVLAINLAGFKLSVFRLIILLCFAYICVTANKKYNVYSAIMILWLIWGIVSIVIVPDKGEWFKEIFFLIVATTSVEYFSRKMDSAQLLVNMCKAFSLFIGIHNIIGYYEMITKNYSWVSPELAKTYGFIYGRIPVSVFYNSNNYATILLFGIAITAIALKYANKKERIIYILIMTSSLVQMYFTSSRANLIALTIGIIFFFLTKRVKNNNKIVLITILLILLGVVSITPIGTTIITKIGEIFDFNILYGSESLRISLLHYGWETFKQTYFLGAGAGNLPVMINSMFGVAGGKLHFWWLEVLFTYGPLIWALYLFSYIKLLRGNFRSAVHGSYVSRVLASYMIAYIIGACSSSSVMGLEPMWMAWAFIIGYRVNYESIGI